MKRKPLKVKAWVILFRGESDMPICLDGASLVFLRRERARTQRILSGATRITRLAHVEIREIKR